MKLKLYVIYKAIEYVLLYYDIFDNNFNYIPRPTKSTKGHKYVQYVCTYINHTYWNAYYVMYVCMLCIFYVHRYTYIQYILMYDTYNTHVLYIYEMNHITNCKPVKPMWNCGMR
jgi:hypothetical protein